MVWKKYEGPNSLPTGVYRWKTGKYSFLGENRVRGAGFENVTSPAFDHWDGWNVKVPKDLMYDEVRTDVITKKYAYECISIEDHEYIAPCPFCDTVPVLNYVGCFIGAGPHQAERWYLSCCAMINGKGFGTTQPESVINFWNKKINNIY